MAREIPISRRDVHDELFEFLIVDANLFLFAVEQKNNIGKNESRILTARVDSEKKKREGGRSCFTWKSFPEVANLEPSGV